MKFIKYLNQLVPHDFIDGPPIFVTKKNKTIELKKEYLCDLFNHIHINYLKYSDDQNQNDIPIQLSSIQLKKWYGGDYSFYVKYLLQIRLIRLVRNYTKGRNCNTYKFLYWKLDHIQMVHYQNRNDKLINNYRRLFNSNNRVSIYSKRLVNSIKGNLQSITIEKDDAIQYLKSQYPDQMNGKYFKNYLAVINIAEKDPYLISDEYGRIHTNFTVLKKEIRNQFLRIDGEAIREKDISNSQALFFLFLLSKNLDNTIDQSELLRFQYDVIHGVLYDNLATYSGKTRADIKSQFFKYLFGSKRTNFKEFNECYPGISKFIKSYKTKLGNYKLLSHKLQSSEGDFIFNSICKELTKQKIKYFTVHDSINVKQSDFNLLDSIFETKLNNLKQEIKDNILNYYSLLNHTNEVLSLMQKVKFK